MPEDNAAQIEIESLRRLVSGLAVASPPSNIPLPDPSTITAGVIASAVRQVRDEFRSAMEAQQELLIVAGIGRHEKAMLRIEAVEKAYEVSETKLNTVPTQLDREAARLTEIFDEKLLGKQLQLDGFRGAVDIMRASSEKYTEAMRENAKEAIQAAFSAAKEVSNNQRLAFEQQIAKSEQSTTKEIEGLKAQLNALKESGTSQVSNLTGRLDRGEGGTAGGRLAADNSRATIASTVGIGGFVVAAVMAVFLITRPPPTPVAPEQLATSTAIERFKILNDKFDALTNSIARLQQAPR